MPVKKYRRLLKTRNFGLCIGLIYALLFCLLGFTTGFFSDMETKILDSFFTVKDFSTRSSIQKGLWLNEENKKINPDILIVGVDIKALQKFGSWPFPRGVHADLVNSFSRISNQNEREKALFLDIFFIDEAGSSIDDSRLARSFSESGRVFLESILETFPAGEDIEQEMLYRQSFLNDKNGNFSFIGKGWKSLFPYWGIQTNLASFNSNIHGFGSANITNDSLDNIVRRQPLVLKYSQLIDELVLEDLEPGYPVDESSFKRLSWLDINGAEHQIELPLTMKSIVKLKKEITKKAPPLMYDSNDDGTPDSETRVIEIFQDYFMPSIAFSLALEYWGASLDDCKVFPGKEIRILRKTKDDIVIPVDNQCAMIINYAGGPSFSAAEGHQTFPVRSYAGYVRQTPEDINEWPQTRAVADKIILVGAFEKGMAEDEKQTPYGMMFGIEIHANSLNTLLTQRFITRPSVPLSLILFFSLIMLIAFIAARMKNLWSLPLTIFIFLIVFLIFSYFFNAHNLLINYSIPFLGMFFSYITIVLYRASTEEREKRKIKLMFGKYVSPEVVAQMLDNPPELGGVDRELTVFFSDIRGFTSLSETLTPQELVKHLNEYLSAMTDIILATGGTLDKYVGDEIMCFWGAPLEVQDHASRACTCALLQKQKLKELNATWPAEKKLAIGIGLNTGVMTVGNMGSTGRMNYTLMGDNVNLGARLEGTNKVYGTMIIVSEYTYALVKDEFIFRELDIIRVKGKNKPVVIYELVDFIS
ncbi:MAG TPA: adenylate/guanylate cyclase domain-containing protein [Treponemataceae bacterium]|nr:adenylate/guanylate cyclase domain-containing protein [Treponemataceae bacterium]